MITKGKQKRPYYAILYGQPGVGKTTLASLIPNSVFLDLEKGTSYLDVARYQPGPDVTIKEALNTLSDNMDSFDTLIIDSLTSLETKHQLRMCAEMGWPSIYAKGYGQSSGQWITAFKKLLTELNQFRDAGKNILLIAHQKLREAKDAITQETYDQFSFDCHKDIHVDILSHIDGCFFLKQKSLVKDDKVIGNGSRVLLTKDRPQYTAKSRWNLPESIENPDAKFWEQLL
jgi:GTPase SAR1 family protein